MWIRTKHNSQFRHKNHTVYGHVQDHKRVKLMHFGGAPTSSELEKIMFTIMLFPKAYNKR